MNQYRWIVFIFLVPRELEILAQTHQVQIEQDIEALEFFSGCEFENKYKVQLHTQTQGIQLFKAREQSDCFQRQCCGRSREFAMNIEDHRGAPIIAMQRPGCRLAQPWCCACLSGNWICNLFDSCIQEITVS